MHREGPRARTLARLLGAGLTGLLIALTLGMMPPSQAAAAPDATVYAQVRVPILLYHYIRQNPYSWDWTGAQLSVTPGEFARQMDWLAAHNYHPTTLGRVLVYLAQGIPLPDNPIILTFDDGYSDLYTAAYPVLRRYMFPATAFVPSSYPGTPGYVTWAQLREMTRSGLLFVGAHGVTHRDLTTLALDQATYELTRSKAEIEDQLGQPVNLFAFPNGHSTGALQTRARNAGYAVALGTWRGASLTVTGAYNWPRISVLGTDSLARFTTYLH